MKGGSFGRIGMQHRTSSSSTQQQGPIFVSQPSLVGTMLVASKSGKGGQFGKGTVPEQAATAAEVKQLGDWLLSTVDQLEQDWNGGLFKNFRPYTIKQIGAQLHTVEDAIAFNTIHEGIHYGYILTFKKLI